MRPTRRSFIAGALSSLAAAPALAQSRRIKVVATFTILRDLVQQVGSARVEVSSLVGPNGDAHTYNPRPGDVARLRDAGLVIANGIGFEGWIDRLLRSSGYQGARAIAARGVRALAAGTTPDPHAWQDVANVKIYVANIREALTGVDPAGASAYAAAAQRYTAQLDRLDAEIRAAYAPIPAARRRIVTSHDAFRYYGDAYGLVFYSPQGVSTDAQPSTQAVARLIEQIRRENITAVFVENMSNPRVVQQIARETGARVGGTLYADALSAGPPANTYVAMMRYNTRLIAGALRGATA